MVRFISKKGEDGKVRHIPISGSGNIKERKYTNLHVQDNYDGNGDNEYTSKGRDPEGVISDVRKEVLRRLNTDAVKATEEQYYYDSSGKPISRAQFLKNGGSFDLVIESGNEKKYQVNGEVSKKDRAWKMSGLGSWIREPDSNIGLEALFGKAVKNESVSGLAALFDPEPRKRKRKPTKKELEEERAASLGALFGNDPEPEEHLYKNGAKSSEKTRLVAINKKTFETFEQDFDNPEAAARAGESLKKQGYDYRIGTPKDPQPRRQEHLYRNGAKSREKKKFEKEYGKKKGDYVYGATVGKVKREREASGRYK